MESILVIQSSYITYQIMSRRFMRCQETGLDYRIARSTPGEYAKEICSIDVSLGNPRCADVGLECTLSWVKGRFAAYEFSLADTLYANVWTLLEPEKYKCFTHDELIPILTAVGDKWIEDNNSLIRKYLGNSYKIRRWEHWRSMNGFSDISREVESLFLSPEWQCYLEKDIHQFHTRKFGTSTITNKARCCLQRFVFDECAGYYLHSTKANVRHVYPGKSLGILRAISNAARKSTLDLQGILLEFGKMKRTDIDLRSTNACKI